jgi:hypothetical protein
VTLANAQRVSFKRSNVDEVLRPHLKVTVLVLARGTTWLHLGASVSPAGTIALLDDNDQTGRSSVGRGSWGHKPSHGRGKFLTRGDISLPASEPTTLDTLGLDFVPNPEALHETESSTARRADD